MTSQRTLLLAKMALAKRKKKSISLKLPCLWNLWAKNSDGKHTHIYIISLYSIYMILNTLISLLLSSFLSVYGCYSKTHKVLELAFLQPLFSFNAFTLSNLSQIIIAWYVYLYVYIYIYMCVCVCSYSILNVSFPSFFLLFFQMLDSGQLCSFPCQQSDRSSKEIKEYCNYFLDSFQEGQKPPR